MGTALLTAGVIQQEDSFSKETGLKYSWNWMDWVQSSRIMVDPADPFGRDVTILSPFCR